MSRVPAPENFDSKGRYFAYAKDIDHYQPKKVDGYGRIVDRQNVPEVTDAWNANLIISYTGNGHKPVIDLDFGARLIPSTQPDHYHLYIDQEISWESYRSLLRSLLDAGLIQRGWYDGAIRSGYTSVRPPWVHKGEKPMSQRETTLPGFIEDGPVILNEDDSKMIISVLRERHDRMYAQLYDELKQTRAELEEAREIIKAMHDVETTARAPLAWG